MRKIFPVLLAVLLVLVSCSTTRKTGSDTVVSSLSGKSAVKDGSIVYGLPRTVFNITVEMERTVEKPGPYWKFAGELLGLTNVISEENESWAITGISVRSAEELDPSQLYVIESSTIFETNLLSMKKEGLILDINPGIYFSSGSRSESGNPEAGRFSSTDLGSDEYFRVQRDTAFRRVNVDSTFIRIPYVVEKRRPLPDEQLAERAARRLMEMREGKHFILSGEATVFPQSEAVINEMNRMEREYLELFTGKTIRERRSFTYQHIPSAETSGKPVKLFQFSELAGVISNEMKEGDAILLELVPEKRTGELNIIQKTQPDDESEEQQFDKLFYRIPDVVNMKISMGDKVLFSSRRLVYQYGQVVKLPSNFVIGR